MFRNYELLWGYLRDLMNETREEQDSINLNLLIAVMDCLEIIAEGGGDSMRRRENEL